KSDTIVNTRVIHYTVDTPELFSDCVDSIPALIWIRQLSDYLKCLSAFRLHLCHHGKIVAFISPNDHRYSALVCEYAHNARSDTFGAAGYDDDFILKKKVHGFRCSN